MTSVNSSAAQGGFTFPKDANTAHKKALHLFAQNFDAIAGQDGKTAYASKGELEKFVAQLQTVPGIDADVSLKLLEFGEKSSLYALAADPFAEQAQGLFAPDTQTALSEFSKADLAEMQAKSETGFFSGIFGGKNTVDALEQQAKDNQATIAKNPELLKGLMAQTQLKQDAAKAMSKHIFAQLLAEQQQAQALAEQAALEGGAAAALGLSPEQMANLPSGDALWTDSTGQNLWQAPATATVPVTGEIPWYDQVDPDAMLNPQTSSATVNAKGNTSQPSPGGATITAGDNTNINIYNQSANPITTQLGQGASINVQPDGSITTSDGKPITPPPASPTTPTTPPTSPTSPTAPTAPTAPTVPTSPTTPPNSPTAPTPTSPTTPTTPTTPTETTGGRAANGIGTINAQGDVTVNIYNGPTSITAPPKETPKAPPTTTPPTETPKTPPTTTSNPEFDVNQRDNTLSIAGGSSIQLRENTVDTLDKKASSTFKTDDDLVGGHMVFASGDDVWAAQKDGVSVVYWDPRQSLKDAGTTPTFEFYAAQPVTIDGVSKQGRLDDDDYILAVSTDQLPKLTGLPSAFQSAYDEMLNPSS